MRSFRQKILYPAAGGLLVMASLLMIPLQASANGSSSGHSSKGWCIPFNKAVAKAPGQPKDWQVKAFYCQPFKWAKGQRQIDVLTHGSTYTHTYWDWPQQSSKYSYVDKTLAAGRAVVNYDRIGNGDSTRPVSTEITMATDAYVLHQLIGAVKFLGYKHVNSIGHSYGSGVALAEAAAYNDTRKLVLTGYLHVPSNPAVTAGNYPANQDPKFAAAGLDNGYLTSRPGTRGTSFHAPDSDPAVVAYDEQTKDITSLTGLLDFLAKRNTPAASNSSNTITQPVLLISGQRDGIFCFQPAVFNCTDLAAVTAHEQPYFTASQQLKVVMTPLSGHDLTLHPTANDSFKSINNWLK